MSNPPASLNRNRSLRRAENILTHKGQPVKELVEFASETDDTANAKPSRGIGASIRRKFKSLSLGRSKSHSDSIQSTRAPPPTFANGSARPTQSRSLTDVTTQPPPPPHANSAPEPGETPPFNFKRHSTQPLIQTLPSVSETPVAEQHLPSAVAPQPEDTPEVGNVRVPQLLQQGTPVTKVSAKKHKKFVLRLDADLGQLMWDSGRRQKIIPIENIKEIRSGADARYYREQFQLSQDYQDRWLTIIYILDGAYKTMHLIVTTNDVSAIWEKTLRELHAIRQELMRGLGNVEVRQAMWEKHYWTGADEERDQKLSFDEVEKLCRRLNINSSREDLQRLFTQSDLQKRGFLDFEDFRRFVKLLKSRPEIHRLYKKLRSSNNGVFDFSVFDKFMREKQKSTLSPNELQTLFTKFSTPKSTATASADTVPTTTPITMSMDAFTSFLLSPDNSAFADQHRDIWHDMTRPLPEYYISSSHNTYLVGHQLVGDSTIEGYIRALLHSCRSVELDIYDGEQEPMIFHGKTFTSKVSLREVCAAIAKYGFVASPYPIIISAEVHCSVPQQELIAKIMIEVFGDMLIRIPPDEQAELKIDQLPSPEDLKGKIMLKTKNLMLRRTRTESTDNDADSTTDPSSSTSDSDAFSDMIMSPGLPPQDARTSPVVPTTPLPVAKSPTVPNVSTSTPTRARHDRRKSESMKDQFSKALQRVRSVGNRAGPSPNRAHPPPEILVPQTPSSILPIQPAGSAALPMLPPSAGIKSPPFSSRRPSEGTDNQARPKPKMSMALVALLVYTVGVKCRGINKKEEYAPEHMFSLSETMMQKMLRFNMRDLIKHSKTHLVRTYPKGTRVNSTNYEPHRFWAAGAQLVAINWQTFDLGYMINHAMFQRNGRAGYVLKPTALRLAQKELLAKRTLHSFDVTVISAQQLPRPRDASGREIADKGIVDPFVEVTLYIPEWPVQQQTVDGNLKVPGGEGGLSRARSKSRERDRDKGPASPTSPLLSPRPMSPTALPQTPISPSPSPGVLGTSTPSRAVSARTSVVRKNGFNPIWEEKLSIPFDCVGDMLDLVFVRFVVGQEDKDTDEPLAVYCASLGSLQHGYRHLPLHDSQLSQYLYSTLFVRLNVTELGLQAR